MTDDVTATRGAAVRPAGRADAEAVADVYAHYVRHSWATFEEQPPTAAEMARRIDSEPRLPWLVAERDGAVVGFAYAGVHRPRAAYRWTVETSVYLREDERGRGTGRTLYLPLLQHLRVLGYVVAMACIAAPNPASVALHESLGFTDVGLVPRVGHKLGAWRDLGWWSLALAEQHERQPPEPLPWTPDAQPGTSACS
ncbi:MAG: N-acetyltransferase [Rhodoferax sp.]|nr:N-acetyltransferase [Actinomycetota bacterium]